MANGRLGVLALDLAGLPFSSPPEFAAITGRSGSGSFKSLRELEAAGLAGSVKHSTVTCPPAHRYYLTTPGLTEAQKTLPPGSTSLLVTRPVSRHWQRALLRRLDGCAVLYRVAASLAQLFAPLSLTWSRTQPADLVISLPNGLQIGLVAHGRASSRTNLRRRLWQLGQRPRPNIVLVTLPNSSLLRQAKPHLLGTPVTALLASEGEAVAARTTDPIWHLPSLETATSIGDVLAYARAGGDPPPAEPPTRPSTPIDISPDLLDLRPPPAYLLSTVLTPVEKEAVDILFRWPWSDASFLAAMLEVSRDWCRRIIRRLESMDLVSQMTIDRRARLALTNRALGMLSRRDRIPTGTILQRWSASLNNPEQGAQWRNVSGSSTGQLLRHIDHTTSVHEFLKSATEEGRRLGWLLAHAASPTDAVRFFQYRQSQWSIRPDAFLAFRQGEREWSCFLEWERRANRPGSMAAKLTPYLRYYSTRQPLEDHGHIPSILVVCEDPVDEGYFVRVCREKLASWNVDMPIFISRADLLRKEGVFAHTWQTPLSRELCNPLPAVGPREVEPRLNPARLWAGGGHPRP